MYKYLLILLVGLPLTASAVIYVKEDSNTITYSDSPLPNGKKLEDIPEVNNVSTETSATVGAPVVTTTTSTTETPAPVPTVAAATEEGQYTNFMITSPKDEQTFQNQPSIPVSLVVQPELQKEHRIQLMLDSKPYGKPAATTDLALQMVERGTHQLAAVIINNQEQILKKSNSVTIFVHRSTLNNPTRRSQQTSQKPINLFTMIRNFI